MTRRLVAVLAVILALSGPGPAQAETVDRFTIKGAQGVIIVPDDWNGSLFIYAHGYTADKRILEQIPEDLSQLNLLLQAVRLPTFSGYASATTTFRSVGWYVKDAIKDIENVRRRFVKTHGKPKHTYLWGHSGGGMVTSTVIEYFPHTYDGAMPMCGPGAGARRNFNGAYDIRVLYEYLCHDIPGAQFLCHVCSDGTSRCLQDADCPAGQTCGAEETAGPPEDGLTPECTEFLLEHPETFNENPTGPGGDFITPRVLPCLGDPSGHIASTPEQAARRDFFLRASQLPESFIITDLFFASIGMAEVVHRRTNGHHPWGNTDVDFVAPGLTAEERAMASASIHRSREDASAVSYMRRFYEPRGRTASKVLTIHALDDGLVIPENEDKYRQAFEAAGRADQLVQLYTSTGGHCGFIPALIVGLPALTAWVEEGDKPDPAAMAAACPACDFTLTTPGPLGLRIVERRQKGEPLHALVCAGEAGDCPAGTTCNTQRHRCQ